MTIRPIWIGSGDGGLDAASFESIPMAKLVIVHASEISRSFDCEDTAVISAVLSATYSVPLQVDRVIQLGEQYKGMLTNDYTLHSSAWILASVHRLLR